MGLRHAITLSSCRLSLNHDPIRLPSRRYSLRSPDYEDQFDFTTLYNDIFWSPDNKKIILIGPPHFNLGKDSPICYIALPSGKHCSPTRQRLQWTDRLELTAPQGTTGLMIECGKSRFFTTPQPNLCEVFRGKRALFTMSKNNNLEWIHDWAHFYARNHGCDAVLFYDNNSDRYSLDDIHKALSTAIPHGEIAVVDWAFRYGVFDGRKEQTIGLWDGFFSQFTIFEHARRRCLSQAEAVVNADIDELVLCDQDISLFELTKTSKTGYLCYSGQWVSAHTTSEAKQRSFKDYHFLTAGGREITEKKWAVDPKRCPDSAQWKVHCVSGMHEDTASLQARIRHFKAINTNWDIDTFLSQSLRTHTLEAEREQLLDDQQLQQILQLTFSTPSHPPAAQLPGDATTRAHATRVKAGRLERQRKFPRAAQLAKAACQMLPQHPGFKLYYASLLRKQNRHEDAITIVAEAESILNSDAATHLQRGYTYLAALNFEQAKDELEQAISLDPHLIDAYEALADLHTFNGDHDKTRSLVVSAPWPTDPADELSAARLSLLHQRVDDHAGAIRYIQDLIRMAPSVYGYYQLGKMQLNMGNLEAAHAALSQAMAELNQNNSVNWAEKTSALCVQQRFWDDDHSSLTNDLACVLLRMGKFSEALTLLQAAVETYPLNPQVHLLLAKALGLLGHSERAKEARQQHAELVDSLISYNFPNGQPGVLRVGHPLWRKWHSDHLQLDRINRLCDRDARAEASDHALALATCREALPFAQLAAIHVLIREKRTQEADHCLQQFIQQHGSSWATFALRANIDMALKNFTSALTWIDRAITGNPATPHLHAQRAKALYEVGQHDDAIKAIKRGLEINPNLLELQFQLCNIQLSKGNLEAARRAAERAQALDASNPQAHHFLSRVQMALGAPEKAVRSALKAVELEPDSGLRFLQLSQIHQAINNLPEAIAAADQAIALEPHNPTFKLHRIKIAFAAGDLPQALALAWNGAEAHPQVGEFYIHISRLEIKQNNLIAAEQAARQATRLEPNTCAAHLFLGRSIQDVARCDEAIAAFSTALTLPGPDNQHATAHLWMAQVYRRAGRIEDALQSAQQAAECDPGFAEAKHLLSLVFDQLGNPSEAIAALSRALELKPGVLEWHLQLSSLHLKQGEHRLALQAAQAAVALDSGNSKAQQQVDTVLKLITPQH